MAIALPTTGEIATRDDVQRYTAVMVALGLVAWIVSNALGNHVLG